MTAVNSRDLLTSPFLDLHVANSAASSSSSIPPHPMRTLWIGCSYAHVKCIEAGLVDERGIITDAVRDTKFPPLPQKSLERIYAERERVVYGTTNLEECCRYFLRLYGHFIQSFFLKGSFLFWAGGGEAVDSFLKVFKLSLSVLGIDLKNLKKPEDIDFELFLMENPSSNLNEVLRRFQADILNGVAKKGINCRVNPTPWFGDTSNSMTLSPISKTPVDFFIYHKVLTPYHCTYNSLKLSVEDVFFKESSQVSPTLVAEEGMSPWQALFDRLLQIVRPCKTINDHGWMKILRDISIVGFQIKDFEIWEDLQRHQFDLTVNPMPLEAHIDQLIQQCEERHHSGNPFGSYCIRLQMAAFMKDRLTPMQRAPQFQKHQKVPAIWRSIDCLLKEARCLSSEIFALLQWSSILLELYRDPNGNYPLTVRPIFGTGVLSLGITFVVNGENNGYLQLCKAPEEAYDLLVTLVSRDEYQREISVFLFAFLLAQPLKGNHSSEIFSLWKEDLQFRNHLRRRILAVHAETTNTTLKIFNFFILLALYAVELAASKNEESIKQKGGILLEMFPEIYALEEAPKEALKICFLNFFGRESEPILQQFVLNMALAPFQSSFQIWIEAFIQTDNSYAVFKLKNLMPRLKGKIDTEIYVRLIGQVLEKTMMYHPREMLDWWKWCAENDFYLGAAYFPLFCQTIFPFADPKLRDGLKPYLFSLGKTLRQFLISVTVLNHDISSYTAALYQLVDALSEYPKLKQRILNLAVKKRMTEALFGECYQFLDPKATVVESSSSASTSVLEGDEKIVNLNDVIDRELTLLSKEEVSPYHMELVERLSLQDSQGMLKDPQTFIFSSFLYFYPYITDAEQKEKYVGWMVTLISKSLWTLFPSHFKFKCDTRQLQLPVEILLVFCQRSFDFLLIEDGIYWFNLYMHAVKKEQLSSAFTSLVSSWMQCIAECQRYQVKTLWPAVKKYQELTGSIVTLASLFAPSFVKEASLECLSVLVCEDAREILQKPHVVEALLNKILALKKISLEQWEQCLWILTVSESSLRHKVRISCWMRAIQMHRFISLKRAEEWLHFPEVLRKAFSSTEPGRIDSAILDVYIILLETVVKAQHKQTQQFLSQTYAWLVEYFREKKDEQALIQFERNLLRILYDAEKPLELVEIVSNVEARIWTPQFSHSVSEDFVGLLRDLCFINYQADNMNIAVMRLYKRLSNNIFKSLWVWNLFLTQGTKYRSFFTVSALFREIALQAKTYLACGFHSEALKNAQEIIQGMAELVLHPDVRSHTIGREVAQTLNSHAMQQFFGLHGENLVSIWLERLFTIPNSSEGSSREIGRASTFHTLDAITLAIEGGRKFSIFSQKRLWHTAIKVIAEIVMRYKEETFYTAQKPMMCVFVLCLFPFNRAVWGSDQSVDYCDRIEYLTRDLIREGSGKNMLTIYGFIAELYMGLINTVFSEAGNPFVGFIGSSASEVHYGAEVKVDKLGKIIDAFLFDTFFSEISERVFFFNHLHLRLIKAYYDLFVKNMAAHKREFFYRPLLEMQAPNDYLLRLSRYKDIWILRKSISLALSTITALMATPENAVAFVDAFLKSLIESITQVKMTLSIKDIHVEDFRALLDETKKLLKDLNGINNEEIKANLSDCLVQVLVIETVLNNEI